MNTKNRRFLRILVMITLFLLLVQYELGMAVNLGPPLPKLAPFGLSSTLFQSAITRAGMPATIHSTLGGILGLISLVNLVVAQRMRVTSVRIYSILAFLTTAAAGILGTSFVLSGFQNDRLSLGMASTFMLTLLLYFLELYALKPGRKTESTA